MSLCQRIVELTVVVATACFGCLLINTAQAQVDIRKLDKPKPVAVIAKPKIAAETETAKKATAALDKEIGLGDVDVTVGELDQFIQEKLDAVGVFIDRRGLQAAAVQSSQRIQANLSTMPLRAALRKLLRPRALKVVVEDEGIVITADYAELARRGIGTDRWTHGVNDPNEAILKKMDQTVSISAVEDPLSDFIAGLSKQVEIPMLIDSRALEEIGLSSEEPVTLQLTNVSLRSGLRLILRELDLTYVVREEVLQITTIESAELNLNNRIYFMEGFGGPGDAASSMRNVIMACIVPDTWDQLGGPSSIIPLIADERPAIIVSATSDVHDQIKELLESLRKAGSTEGLKIDVPNVRKQRF